MKSHSTGIQHLHQWLDVLYPRIRRISIEYYHHFRTRYDNDIGVAENKRVPPLIVSLTTMPSRIDKVHLCIGSLLRQSLKPDQLILWLGDDIREDSIPEKLQRFTKRGLQLKFCKNIRPYKKIIFTLKENSESVIVTADDDILYHRDWLKELYDAHKREPEYIQCHRAHLMKVNFDGSPRPYCEWSDESPGIEGPSLLLFPTGAGGVLYPPDSLHYEVLNEDLFLKICPTNDDIWLKAMSLMNGVPCKKVAPVSKKANVIRNSQGVGLAQVNVLQARNDRQISAVFEHYQLYPVLAQATSIHQGQVRILKEEG
jgi:hypothetical protein